MGSLWQSDHKEVDTDYTSEELHLENMAASILHRTTSLCFPGTLGIAQTSFARFRESLFPRFPQHNLFRKTTNTAPSELGPR